MQLLFGSHVPRTLTTDTAAVIGNFDGVHRGHQHLLSCIKQQARILHLPVLVVLFEPQPGEYFLKHHAPVRLYHLREKLTFLRECGVDYVYCVRFNSSWADMAPDHFAEHIIFNLLRVKYLLIGEDFRFGKNRAGDFELLKKYAQTCAATVNICPRFDLLNERVSSTRVREALAHSQFNHVHTLLGRHYHISGRVMYGQGLARQWGVPTANISMKKHAFALRGVFCVFVVRGHKIQHAGVANAGFRPTVDGTRFVLEVHLLDFHESLYGERLDIIFVHKLRDELKFASIEQLKTQIMLDLVHARDFFQQPTARSITLSVTNV